MTRAPFVAIAAIVALAGCGGGNDNASAPEVRRTITTEVKVERAVGGADFDPAAIYQRDAPSVVTIISVFSGGGGLLGGGAQAGQGSGFVISDRGEIVTNAHVVADGEGAALHQAREEEQRRRRRPDRGVGRHDRDHQRARAHHQHRDDHRGAAAGYRRSSRTASRRAAA